MNDIIISLYNLQGIQFGNFKTKSGKMHPIYINLRVILGKPLLAKKIAQLFYEKLGEIDLISPVPMGTVYITSIISSEYNLPMILPREIKKEYGMCNEIDGVYEKNNNVTVIEDIVTTGASLDNICNILEKNELQIINKLCFLNYTNRQDIIALTTINEIVECLYKNHLIIKEIYDDMQNFIYLKNKK